MVIELHFFECTNTEREKEDLHFLLSPGYESKCRFGVYPNRSSCVVPCVTGVMTPEI